MDVSGALEVNFQRIFRAANVAAPADKNVILVGNGVEAGAAGVSEHLYFPFANRSNGEAKNAGVGRAENGFKLDGRKRVRRGFAKICAEYMTRPSGDQYAVKHAYAAAGCGCHGLNVS